MHTCMRVCACARVWRERGRAHASSNDPHSPSPSRRASEVGRAGLRETESEVVAACPPVVTGGTAALSWAFPWDCPEVAELQFDQPRSHFKKCLEDREALGLTASVHPTIQASRCVMPLKTLLLSQGPFHFPSLTGISAVSSFYSNDSDTLTS